MAEENKKVERIFSEKDAKDITIEPERRMGKIEKFQQTMAKVINPVMEKFKGVSHPEKETEEVKSVEENGNER